MTSKEILLNEIARLDDEGADVVLHFVRQLSKSGEQAQNGSLLTKLKGVRITAPADFSANLDLYTSGEKRVDENLH